MPFEGTAGDGGVSHLSLDVSDSYSVLTFQFPPYFYSDKLQLILIIKIFQVPQPLEQVNAPTSYLWYEQSQLVAS